MQSSWLTELPLFRYPRVQMAFTKRKRGRTVEPTACEIAGPGIFCISIDLELSWGIPGGPNPAQLDSCVRLEREIVRRLLGLFRQYDIAASWAIVGKLLEEPGVASPGPPDAWYAPQLIEEIRAADPRQEIGSHTFSHIYFTEEDRPTLAADLEAARAIHQRHGLDFTSFVFPGDLVGNTDLLAQVGLKIYRGRHNNCRTRQDARNAGKRAQSFVRALLPTPAPTVWPRRREHGLIELPSSLLLIGRSGLRRLVLPRWFRLKGVLGLRAAARRKGVFHLWFHPSNFYAQMDTQFRILEQLLQEAARLRAEGTLRVATMGDIARELEVREPRTRITYVARKLAQEDGPRLRALAREIWVDGEVGLADRGWGAMAEPPVIVAEDPNGEILGIGSYLRFSLHAQGRVVPATWFVDLFVSPLHQGKGIGKLLTRAVSDESPVTASLSQTDASYAVLRRLGWTKRRPFRLFANPLLLVPGAAKLLEHKTACEDIRLEVSRLTEDSLSPEFDVLWERLRNDLPVCAVRDAAALRVRYVSPGTPYTLLRAYRGQSLVGYMIACVYAPGSVRALRRIPGGAIVDYLGDLGDQAVFARLLETAMLVLSREGARVALCLVTVPELERILHRHGFVDSSTPGLGRVLKRLHVALTFRAETGMPELDAAPWYMTLGDCDIDLKWRSRRPTAPQAQPVAGLATA